MACTACPVCFISTANSQCNKKERKEEAYPWKAGASSGHTTNLKQSILETLDIYVLHQLSSKLILFLFLLKKQKFRKRWNVFFSQPYGKIMNVISFHESPKCTLNFTVKKFRILAQKIFTHYGLYTLDKVLQ